MTINLPKRAEERLFNGVRKFQAILLAAQKRDANESDTVTIVVDMLADVFGFDKYAEITSEFAIRGTFCDLALKLGGASKPSVLIEVKAIGQAADTRHVKQAVDYAANQGVEWVVLTTGITWKLFKVIFGKPINQEEVISFNFLEIDAKDNEQLSQLYALGRDGWAKELPTLIHTQNESINRYMLAAFILSEPILDALRREIKKFAHLKPGNEMLAEILETNVLKRETIEGEKADGAAKRVNRYVAKTKKLKLLSATPGQDVSRSPIEKMQDSAPIVSIDSTG